jgi:uncharacterized membrane-anchored protein
MTTKRKIQASSYIREDLYAIVQKASHLKGMSVSSYLSLVGVQQARKDIKEIGNEIKENEKNGIYGIK